MHSPTLNRLPALDENFGNGGKVILDSEFLGNAITAQSVYAVAQRPDNSMLLATGFQYQGLVIALNPDGSLDCRFNEQGYRLESFDDPREAEGIDVQLMPDGRVLFTGWLLDEEDFQYIPAFAMYTPDGQRDTSFGNAGVTVVELPPPFNRQRAARSTNSNRSTAPVITPDGSILIPYVVDNFFGLPAHTLLIRLTAQGQLDEAFHGKGYTELAYQGRPCHFDAFIRQPAIGPLERLLFAGSCDDNGHREALLAAFTPEGESDESFADEGFRLLADDGAYTLLTLFQAADEKPLAAGFFNHGPGSASGLLTRFNADGSTDRHFNHGEPLLTPPDNRRIRFERVDGALDGLIVAAGQVITAGSTLHGILARYLPDGGVDETFGDSGRYEVPESGGFWGMSLQTDGKLVVVGSEAGVGSISRYQLSPMA